MKKYLLILCLLCVPTVASSEEVELFSDEVMLGNDVLEKNTEQTADEGINKDDQNTEELNEEDVDKKKSLFGFFVQPFKNLFSSEKDTATDDIDITSDLDKAIKKADEGDLESQMNLGYTYLYGTNDVKQDYDKAFKYYNMAAQQNDPIALNNLGSLYFSGIGTNQDIKTALILFEQASQLGNDNASVNLAFIYLSGGKKNQLRNQKAIELFKKAADEGNKIARFMLGYAYYKGFVVSQDMAQAFALVKASASGEEKIDEAQIILAQMYINGDGTIQNYKKAISAYRNAVQQGNIDACNKLADIYRDGRLTEVNNIAAHTIYNIAASYGDKDAAQKRDKLGSKMNIKEIDEAQKNAKEFKVSPSELTYFIRQTYGNNIRHYIDINI